MENNSSFASRLTGVTEPKKPAAAAQTNSFSERLTGQTPDPSKFQRYETFDPISEGRKTINLSATYTDSLESYTKYGVATNPFNDWNEQRAQNQSTTEKWINGLTKATITAVGSVYENTVGVVAGLGSLAFADSHSYYDNPVGRQVDSMNEWAREVMPNYYTQQEQNASVLAGLGTANFWADKFAGGVGYTLGALATAWIGVGELGVLGRAGSLVGRGAKGVAVGEEVAAGAAALAEAGEAGAILADGAKLGSKQKSLWTTVKAAGESRDVGKGLESLDRAVRVRTATKRLVAGTNMSLAEASVEARESKNQFIQEQKTKWEEDHPGEQMPVDVLEGVEKSAYAAGNLTFGINLPILTVTNILMFGKTLEGAKIGDKAMFAAERDVAKSAGEQWAIKTGSTKVGQMFGKAQRNFGKPVESMFEEGFQEASQFAASDMARSYYGQKFHDGTGDMSESLSTALSKTFGTKEGLENVLIGALVGGGTGAISRLAGAEKKLMKMKTANTTEALSILNAGGTARALEVAEQNAENIYLVNQMKAAKDRNKKEGVTAAEITANDLDADKHRMRLIHNVFTRLHRLGATDYALDQFDDAASMSEDEFKTAFGYDSDRTVQEQTGGKSQMQVISDTKAKMELAIKRSEQVHNILSQYNPGQGLIQKIKDGMQSEQTKNNKLIEKNVRDLYGRMLTFQLLDIDTIDEHIEKQYDKLLELAPALSAFKPEEVKYRLKVGQVTLDKDGQPQFGAQTDVKADDKFSEVLKEIFGAKYALSPSSPVDAMEFQQAVRSLAGLIQDRTKLSESFNNLAGNPREMDLYVEAQELMKEAAQQKAADDRATQAIEGSETADELRDNISDEASPEVRAAAAEKVEELEKAEQDIITEFEKLSDEELKALDFDEMSPMEQSALLKVQQQRNEEARKTNGVKVSEQLEENNEQEEVSFTTEELEAADNIVSYGSGTKFAIDGKFYITGTGDPAESLIINDEGNVIGVELIDLSTNNKIKWVLQDEMDPSVPENIVMAANILKENAKSRMLQYSILIGMAEIRSEEEVTALSVEEDDAIIDFKAEVIMDDIAAIVANEESGKEELKAAGVFDPTVDIAVTAGLSAEQIRAQVEVIEQDILELDEIIKRASKNSKSNGRNMSREQFRKQPKIKDRLKQRLIAKQLLESKIAALIAMKPVDQENVEEVDTSLSPPETEFVMTLTNQQIQKLERVLDSLEMQAVEYSKMLDGTYPDQDPDAAEAGLANLTDKINRVKIQIELKKNLINKINEDAEIKQRIEDDNNTEGPGTAAEGEVTEGENLDSTAGPSSTGLDGGISTEEAERIKKEKLEALAGNKTTATGDGKTPAPKKSKAPKNVSDGKNLDVQLSKSGTEGSKNANGKFIVQADGGINTASNTPVLVDRKEVEMDPSLLTDPEVAPEGSYVTFQTVNSDWWKTQIPAEVADNPEAYKEWMETVGWQRVPIVMVDDQGQTLNILKAYDPKSSEGFQGLKRKDIVKYLNDDLIVGAKVVNKFFDTKSISNVAGADGKPHFYPASDLHKNGATSVLYVGNDVKSGERHWRVAFEGEEGEADVTASVTSTENVSPGQIGIVTMNPSGQPIVMIASTKKMSEGGMTIALNHITKESPEAYKYAQIVGCNSLEVQVATEDQEVSTEDAFIASELQPDNVQNFMMTYQTEAGGNIFVFYSPSAKSLVRINEEDLKYALLGGLDPRFGFIQDTQNEQGYTKFQAVKQDQNKYTEVGTKIAEEFKAATMSKRFQVDKTKFGLTENFTSPLTGKVYEFVEGEILPYMQYLSNPEEFEGQAREDGSGTNSILAVDIKVNVHGSVFHDVNINLGPLVVDGADVDTMDDLKANEVADTIDSNSETRSTPELITTPENMQEEIVRQIFEDQKKVKGRTPSKNEKGEDIISYYVIETGNTHKYKTVDSDKVDAEGNAIQITGELLDRTTSKIPDTFDKSKSGLYENSRIAGTTSDKILREYFEKGVATKPAEIEDKAFTEMIQILDNIKIQMEKNGQKFLTNNFVFFDAASRVAGEIDILVLNKDGSFSIYDVKTFTAKSWGGFKTRYSADQLTKQERYSLQLSIYSNMFQNMYNMRIRDIKIVPFILEYDNDGLISSVESRVIVDMPFSLAADEIVKPIPVKKTKTPAVLSKTQINSIAAKVAKDEELPTDEMTLYINNTDIINKRVKELYELEDPEVAPGDQLIEYKGNKYVVSIAGTITNSKGKSINPTSPVGKGVLAQVDFDTLGEDSIPEEPVQVSATPMADSETSIVGDDIDEDLFFDIEETEGEETGKKPITFADITARFGQNDLPAGVEIDPLDADPEASNSDSTAEALKKKQEEAKKKGEETKEKCKTKTKK
jgi:hypothetical protein